MNRILFILNFVTLYVFPGYAQENGPFMAPVTDSVLPKMCSCQLLEIQSQHDKKLHVGIFAEKNQPLKKKNNFHVMDAMIRKEMSYLRRGFVDEVKVLNTYKSHTDCMTLYTYLKQQDKKFRMCDILNVDALLIANRR